MSRARPGPAPGLSPAAAALWGALRVVVVDVETTSSREGTRICQVAVVTCRGGRVTGSWSSLVNPQVPIHAKSTRLHGISDEHVATEPVFADLAEQVARALTPVDGEQVVLVAHNVGFDVGVLRAEFARLGQTLPEVPTLDTMRRLPRAVGVRPADASLAGLLDTLGIINTAPHDALADATATAHALIKLLALSADQTATDPGANDEDTRFAGFDELLTATSAGTTLTVSARGVSSGAAGSYGSHGSHGRDGSGGATDNGHPVPLMDPGHAADHSWVLPARPTRAQWTAWRNAVTTCMGLRCHRLADRIDADAVTVPVPVLRCRLEALLGAAVTTGDAPGAATLLGAMGPLLRQLEDRKAVTAWARAWTPRLSRLSRCGQDRCSACQTRAGCPLEVYPHDLAHAVLGTLTAGSAKSALRPSGVQAGTGALTTLRERGLPAVAAHAAWLLATWWRAQDQHGTADTVIRLAWLAGLRDPRTSDAYAGLLAAPGREPDLRAALAVCQQALTAAGSSTDPAARSVGVRHAMIEGRLQRLRVRYTSTVDQDGQPVPARNRFPVHPKRSHRLRFARTGPFSAPTDVAPASSPTGTDE